MTCRPLQPETERAGKCANTNPALQPKTHRKFFKMVDNKSKNDATSISSPDPRKNRGWGFSRRKALMGIGALVAVPSAVKAATQPHTASPGLVELIEQHSQIYTASDAVNARVLELVDHPDRPSRTELRLHEICEHAGHHLAWLHKRFLTVAAIDEYFSRSIADLTQEIRKWEAMGDNPLAVRWARESIKRDWQAATAKFGRRKDALDRWDRASGLESASNESDRLLDRLNDLEAQIIEYRCLTVADVQAKSDHFIRLHEQRGIEIDDLMLPVLRSMAAAKGGEL
ncbi:MAG: hypothetical protein GY807_06910 [Gammaproteobacteria bacterium]|nr:hypothetical protein [Gammaproteobacteria bacterium]